MGAVPQMPVSPQLGIPVLPHLIPGIDKSTAVTACHPYFCSGSLSNLYFCETIFCIYGFWLGSKSLRFLAASVRLSSLDSPEKCFDCMYDILWHLMSLLPSVAVTVPTRASTEDHILTVLYELCFSPVGCARCACGTPMIWSSRALFFPCSLPQMTSSLEI